MRECGTTQEHTALLEVMVDAGGPLTIAALVSGMKLAGTEDLDKAERLFETPSQKLGIAPDRSVYDCLTLVGTSGDQGGKGRSGSSSG